MVIKLDGLSEKEKKAQLEFAFLYPKSFELIKQEGRVEGAINELKIIIKRNSNFKYSRLDMIEFCEKRLVKLEKKGVN